jgi:AraC-like DNA-binding protein
MMVYCALAMRQTRRWMLESLDENFSNPDDFPFDFARRVWLLPIVMTLFVWPPFVFDSPLIMAVMNILLSVFNIVMLLFVLPAWRRESLVPEDLDILVSLETSDNMTGSESQDTEALVLERERKLVEEIETFVRDEKGYLDAHLKLENVVEHCSYSRSYVSNVFQKHFGGFSRYVNMLRLEHYDKYVLEHPNFTKDTAAQESGFTNYNAYYKAKERLAE